MSDEPSVSDESPVTEEVAVTNQQSPGEVLYRKMVLEHPPEQHTLFPTWEDLQDFQKESWEDEAAKASS